MPNHTNNLVHETSPYLLQHAHNPVNWYPWGEEALNKAVAENKPILVSIGYAACHWCHVMERESFEDEATARIMNEHFINIKIDREERPDLDHIYMDAVQAMTGQGGWPLNVFLLPNKQPFYGGTYFPPVKAYNRPSWTEVLNAINDAFQTKREELEQQADNLTQHLHQANQFGMQSSPIDAAIPKEELFTKQQIDTIKENLLKQADKEWGGFGRAPKFPGSFNIQYLLRYYHLYKDQEALDQALLSLDKMLQGGLYDQLGGGFARYATDDRWLIPHFEKMLYDNALLIDVLCEAYQITGNEVYAQTIAHTIQFIKREMMSPDGLFYAALDADSEGVEGKFYTWQKAEIDALLPAEDAQLFCEYYDVTEEGNWEEQNILWVQQPLKQFCATKGMDETLVSNSLTASRAILLAERSHRIRPGLDDKILLGWNALMIHAISKAAAVLQEDSYKQMAVTAMEAVFAYFKQSGSEVALHHTYKEKTAKYPAFVDDYAYLIRALIALQEVTGDLGYFDRADALVKYTNEHFADETQTFFYYTDHAQNDVIVRKKEIYDGATPSGNAIMAQNLLYLSIVFDNKSYQKQGIEMISRLSQTITRYPTSFGVWANQMLQLLHGTAEIAIVGEAYITRMKEAYNCYIPFKVLLGAKSDQPKYPLLADRMQAGRTLVYLCKDYHCIKPVDYIKEIINLL
ncbi:hypothetical protein LX64_02776 [Chitinophaga skermanii]|uniref:Spermatogenesis-associated protein 20-like TRX domain-containing protein n=1 Tax=Chitinophaga skermanii TaxID=331697 RepID=A0A327QH76_9BACT|nr:thioredoxin domain-containing protein [Chitinophaga skermanii]RAJ03899.1 hypothetical protein LX64_02776 [Chitinophaga skermanii]